MRRRREEKMETPLKTNGEVSAFKPGMIVHGTVVKIAPFGAYVQLASEVTGLVLIPEISNARIRHPSDVLAVGMCVECEVLIVDAEKRKISLSTKRLEPREKGKEFS
jgi:ribosomal protein S1